MSNKIKLVVAIVVIVAGFSVYKLANYLNVLASNGPSLQRGTPLPAADSDPDHDGLDNAGEAVWNTDPYNPDSDRDGFKDGEEIKSGHNPLIPGPDDKLGQENLTKRLSELTIAGLAAGDLKPDSKTYAKSMDDITASILDSAKAAFFATIDVGSIPAVEANTTNMEAYLRSLVPLTEKFGNLLNGRYARLKNDLNIIGENGFTAEIRSYSSIQAGQYKEILGQGLAMTVPKNFQKNHAIFLSLVQQMQKISEAVSQGDRDPVRAALAFDSLGNIYPAYLDLIADYLNTMKDSGIDISIFQ